MNRLELKVPPAIVAAVAVAFMWLIREGFATLTLPLAFSREIAIGLCVAGIGIAAVGVLQFRNAGTTLNPHSVANASTVVSTGVYAFTRNPMYLGIVLCLIGVAVYLSNVATIIGIPVFVLYMNRFQIGPEERTLTELFGDSYTSYKSSTRRWV